MQAKPVALALHHDSKLPRIGGEHAHLLSLGPIDRHRRRQLGQRFDRRQCVLGIGNQPFVSAGTVQVFEKWQRVENCFDIRAFRREIAARADGFAADRRHQPSPSVAGCQTRSVRTQRRDDKT